MADLPRILLADGAKASRAALIQFLAAHYSVREVADGDQAWEALVLDPAIRAVIVDGQIPKMSAAQLIDRLRTSRLRHLQKMPCILLGDEPLDEGRERAQGLGASDYFSRGLGGAVLLQGVQNLLNTPAVIESPKPAREHLMHDPVSGLYTRKYLELQAAQALSHSARHGFDVSVMVVGFDAYARLSQTLGAAMADEVGQRFAKMLAAKVRQEDSLGHLSDGQYAVVSPGTSPALCASFAERVRQAVEVSKLNVQGQTLSLTVSIGLAGVPVDRVTSAGALLDLAGQRMALAMRAGGNRTEAGGTLPVVNTISLAHALELLAANRPAQVVPHLDALLVQLMPLLTLMDKELAVQLPVTALEQYLAAQKARPTSP